ncbi:MAG: 3-keto-disaccharide hydrolase [Candidatus Halalkalibacterium sp. M3_1C_030]
MTNAQNTLTEQEKEEGWELLFDGASTDGWKSYNGNDFPDEGWEVDNGMLTVLSQGDGGDIITEEKYGNFELKLEWRVQKSGNSGIFYRAMEQPTQPIYWSAPEMQILDNENHPDAEMGEDGNRKAGSLYDLIPAKPQNANPHGEWNSVRIVANGPKIEHWQNGEKVLEYELWTNEWYEMIRNSKFASHPEFGDARKGYIGLQDHGDRVNFRNIKIKELE